MKYLILSSFIFTQAFAVASAPDKIGAKKENVTQRNIAWHHKKSPLVITYKNTCGSETTGQCSSDIRAEKKKQIQVAVNTWNKVLENCDLNLNNGNVLQIELVDDTQKSAVEAGVNDLIEKNDNTTITVGQLGEIKEVDLYIPSSSSIKLSITPKPDETRRYKLYALRLLGQAIGLGDASKKSDLCSDNDSGSSSCEASADHSSIMASSKDIPGLTDSAIQQLINRLNPPNRDQPDQARACFLYHKALSNSTKTTIIVDDEFQEYVVDGNSGDGAVFSVDSDLSQYNLSIEMVSEDIDDTNTHYLMYPSGAYEKIGFDSNGYFRKSVSAFEGTYRIESRNSSNSRKKYAIRASVSKETAYFDGGTFKKESSGVFKERLVLSEAINVNPVFSADTQLDSNEYHYYLITVKKKGHNLP